MPSCPRPPVRAALLGALFVTLAVSLRAQEFPAPPGWKWVMDAEASIGTKLDPPEGKWLFGTMAPGWHITTRPGVLLFEPSHAARGRFVVESESFLFPGTSAAGFGVFVGGRDLDKTPAYVAFVIRRDGSAAVESVEGGRTTLLHPWTKVDAVVPGTEKDQAKNLLRVEAEAAAVTFLINGKKVAEVQRDGTRFDGVIGLRVGDHLNLHVTNLDLTHRLALPRRAK